MPRIALKPCKNERLWYQRRVIDCDWRVVPYLVISWDCAWYMYGPCVKRFDENVQWVGLQYSLSIDNGHIVYE